MLVADGAVAKDSGPDRGRSARATTDSAAHQSVQREHEQPPGRMVTDRFRSGPRGPRQDVAAYRGHRVQPQPEGGAQQHLDVVGGLVDHEHPVLDVGVRTEVRAEAVGVVLQPVRHGTGGRARAQPHVVHRRPLADQQAAGLGPGALDVRVQGGPGEHQRPLCRPE